MMLTDSLASQIATDHMIRRTPLRRISKKRQHELTLYRRLKRQHISAHPVCEVAGCSRPSVDIHHRLPLGRGGRLNDASIFMGVCRACHNKIHLDPKWAEEHNYLWKVKPIT
jgi:hypothetical protein